MNNKSLQECLNYIQVNLNVPKNLTNSYQNYKYRNLEGIFEGLKPLLKETGCIVTISDSVEMIGERYYIKATASIIKGEESISCDGWARETESRKGMDDAQCSGATSTYARRYSISSLLCIDDNQEHDSMDNAYTVTDEQKTRYQELLQSGCYDGEKANINKWWKGLTTYEQAEKGLQTMQTHVNKLTEGA